MPKESRGWDVRRGCPPPTRDGVWRDGSAPPRKICEILFLKMVHVGAFLYALNNI